MGCLSFHQTVTEIEGIGGMKDVERGVSALTQDICSLWIQIRRAAERPNSFSPQYQERAAQLEERVNILKTNVIFPENEAFLDSLVFDLHAMDSALSYLCIPLSQKSSVVPAKTQEVAIRYLEGEEPVSISQQRLGSGAQADVVAGNVSGVPCAIKKARNPNDTIVEYDRLAKFNHPHIISVLAVTKNQIILPLAKNGNLKNFWEKVLLGEVDLSAEDVQKMLYQISEALAAVDEAGYVYLDLKLENILVQEDGNILLSDFGMTAEKMQFNTRMETRGTILYLPPENLRGESTAETSEKIDVWSFGILIWMLLHKEDIAHPSFVERKENSLAALYTIARASYLTSAQIEAQLDENKVARFDPNGTLRQIMIDCLKYQPSERPQMADVCAHLYSPQF